jgi:hypothetical protein
MMMSKDPPSAALTKAEVSLEIYSKGNLVVSKSFLQMTIIRRKLLKEHFKLRSVMRYSHKNFTASPLRVMTYPWENCNVKFRVN